MPKGMARTHGSTSEAIQHFSHIRLRVTGAGTLKTEIRSLDDINIKPLKNLPLSPKTNIEPTLLTNFVEQRARFKFYTDGGSWMRVNRIVVFIKDYGSEFPM